MKSKFDAFRNHMVYMNLKNSNVKMSYSIQNGFQCKWAPKNDQEEEKMALDILKITMEYWCVLKQQENKKYKVVYFLSFHDMIPWQWLHLFLRSQLIVYAVFV